MTERPEPPHDPQSALRRRVMWHRVGYILSALWVGGILVATGGDVRDPLFNYIFIVPLAGWAAGILIGTLLGRKSRTPPKV